MKKIYLKKYKLLYVGLVIIIIGYLGEINTKQANVSFSSILETKKIQKEIYLLQKMNSLMDVQLKKI